LAIPTQQSGVKLAAFSWFLPVLALKSAVFGCFLAFLANLPEKVRLRENRLLRVTFTFF
jgi:uncharacterized integral membrane protein